MVEYPHDVPLVATVSPNDDQQLYEQYQYTGTDHCVRSINSTKVEL
jgi:hypothetical protein